MNWTNTKCVVLCAGKGSRLFPASLKRSKVVLDITGRPILSYVVEYWRKFTNDFIFVVKFKKEQVASFVKSLPINAEIVEQEEYKGIADAIFHVKDKVSGPFIVVLGDCICKGDFSFPGDMEQGVGVWRTDDADAIRRSYSVRIKDGLICEVVEKPKKTINDLCGMGYYFFDPRVFDYIASTKPSALRGEKEITDVIQKMIDGGEKITAVTFNGHYFNINYIKDMHEAERVFK